LESYGADDVMTFSDYESIVATLRGRHSREEVKKYAKINWTKVKETVGRVGRMILPGVNALFPETIPFNGVINRGFNMLDQPSRLGSNSSTWTPKKYSLIYQSERR